MKKFTKFEQKLENLKKVKIFEKSWKIWKKLENLKKVEKFEKKSWKNWIKNGKLFEVELLD